MHYSQQYLDEALASYEECGVIGGINLWGSAHGIYERARSGCGTWSYAFDTRGIQRGWRTISAETDF